MKHRDTMDNVFDRAGEALESLKRLRGAPSGKSVISKKFTPSTINASHGGQQAIYEFPNGYGASVINSSIAYGGLELAVLRDGGLCYSTPVTDDVEGNLDAERLDELLTQISELPKPT